MREELRRVLIELVEALDPKYGDILYLRFVLEMRNVDIAQYLGVTPNYVNVHVKRGPALLKKAYGEKINEMHR